MTKKMAVWTQVQQELTARREDYAAVLPEGISVDRFVALANAYIKQHAGTKNDLLTCTPRSLFAAFTSSAHDGLLPDGKQGAIVKFRTRVAWKEGGEWRHRWEEQAQWMPMVFGLRKRARELDGILVTAEVVYSGDHFVITLGDEPSLVHHPAPLGKDRGEMIGAYAIYRDAQGRILHREVMDRDQIEAVGRTSKSWVSDKETGVGRHTGLLWRDFETEAWRKTVVRRGFKSVPVGMRLEAIISRDDDTHTFDVEEEAPERKALPPVVGRRNGARDVVQGPATDLPPEVGEGDAPEPPDDAAPQTQEWLSKYDEAEGTSANP